MSWPARDFKFDLTISDAVQQQECYIEQMKSIATAFGAPQKPENELLDLLAKQHKGTCKWLTDNDQFERWLFCDTELVKSLAVDINPADVCPRFIWLNGLPGSGKSVATAHVIRYLESLNRNCSYFFFRNNDTARVTALLLNLAYQMAASNLEVRHVLVSMIEMSEVTDIQDHTIIWNNIFLSRIFNVAFTEPHFWVIDALDECNINSLRALIPMLAKIDSKLPLKIFVSSRYDDHVERLFKQERVEVTELHTSQEGSLKDIDTYIRSRERLVSGGNGEKMFEDILQRSNGNFLWTHLTVNILDDLFSVEQMRNALNGVPSEMKGLFKDILEKIANGASADLARCMLTWAICTPAPLTADELREAVRLDIKHTIVASVSVSQICKSLITVDRDSRIQLMHQTVKEFLTSADSDFYINVRQAHERLATVCLTHLSGPNFLSVTRRRPHIATASAGEVFDRYASANFSYHLAHSHSTSRELMTLLTKLINNNILTWIERVAVMGTLTPFFHAIQNLGRYLSRQLDTTAPFDSEYQTVSELITDLTHIASVFGLSLLDSPSCIFTLIPPLCPTSSIIQRTFAARSRHKLICSSNQTWDARLSCLAFPSSTKTMAANNKYHVVGLANGNIRIFNTSSLEEVATLSHGQPVRHLAFGNVSNMLASCSVRTLTLWDSTLKRMWSRQLPERPTVAFAVYFSSDDTRLLVCVKGNVNKAVCVYRAEDGCEMTSISLNDSGSSSDSDSDEGALRERFIPDVLRLSPILGYAVIAYRSTLPKIYRLEPDDTLEEICVFSKDGRNPSAGMYSQVLDVAFCPAIELGLMAISYQDGEIVTVQFDQWQAHKENMYLLHARILAASPDGNTLAAGDNDGGVVLFDFDTLRPLQRVATLDDVVAGILFGHNSLRLYDVRGTVCNVWEPTVLVRKGSADDSSTGPEEQQADPFEPKQFDEVKTITAITQAGSDHFVFCGREDGTITVHDINTGRILLELELHAAIIHHLEWSSHRNCLLSVDAAGKCKLTQLSAPPSGPWSMKENTLEHRANSTVIQALLHHERLTVLLSTRDGEELLEDGRVLVSSFSFGAARWIYHPIQQESLLHVDGDKIHLHSWNGLRRETGEAGVHVKLPDEVDLPLTNEWVHRMGMDMLVQAVQVHTHTKTGFLALSPSEVQSDSTSVAVSSLIRRLLSGVKVVLGIHGSNIYFLSHRGWICSLSTKSLPDPRHYIRHFFIPSFWQTGREPLIKIVSRHSVAFAYRDELIVFHQFLDNEFKISFDEVP